MKSINGIVQCIFLLNCLCSNRMPVHATRIDNNNDSSTIRIHQLQQQHVRHVRRTTSTSAVTDPQQNNTRTKENTYNNDSNKKNFTTTTTPPNNDTLKTNSTTTNNNNNNNHNNTTTTEKDLRIVGGVTIKDGNEYPYIGFPTGSKNCVGTLFHTDMILTAASCTDAFDSGIFIGGTTIDGVSSRRMKLSTKFIHPQYNSYTNENDIMILKLTKPIYNIPKVILNLNQPTIPTINTGVEVLGYGAISDTKQYSTTLQRARYIIAPSDRCSQYKKYNNNTMICTWFPSGGRDSCDGDAGGPIVLRNTPKNYQVGIVSFGHSCGSKDHPSVNTRIVAFSDFIRQTVCTKSSYKPSSPSTTSSANNTISSTISCSNLPVPVVATNTKPSITTIPKPNPLLPVPKTKTTKIDTTKTGNPLMVKLKKQP